MVIQEYTPFQTRHCEIKEALQIVCESHDLVAAQVWIPCENLNHVPYKSSLEGTEANKQMLTVKFVGYCADSDDDHLLSAIKDYCDSCDMLPLKIGQGLVGRTLQTYEPHFCTNIYDPDAIKEMWNKKLLWEMLNKKDLVSHFATVECSCLGICLRSIDTGDLDYAFEFLWPRKQNYLILLESLLLTLKRCLPGFKFASGSELGDELLVLDVENSTGSGTGSSIFWKVTDCRQYLKHWKKQGDRWQRIAYHLRREDSRQIQSHFRERISKNNMEEDL